MITDEVLGQVHVYVQENVLVFGSNTIPFGNVHTIEYVIVWPCVFQHQGTTTGVIGDHWIQDTVTFQFPVGAVSATQTPLTLTSQALQTPHVHAGWFNHQHGIQLHQDSIYQDGQDKSDVHIVHHVLSFVIVIECVQIGRSSHFIQSNHNNCSWHFLSII